MINYRPFAVATLVVVALTILGFMRLQIDTDVVRSLPSGERVVADALEVFTHHPIHDQIAVDITQNGDDPDGLVAIGAFVETKMKDSGLFAQVGIDAIGELLPELAMHTARNLPLLFSEQELEQQVAPLLTRERIDQRLSKLYGDLSSMDGIGQAGFIHLDPLGLKDLVMARMAPLAPSLNSSIYRGQLLSADRRHVLVTARPLAGGTDTASARRIAELLSECSRQLTEQYATTGREVTLTPVGAYRAALDNERIIRHDVQLALVLATLGIGLLLLFAFPRPLIGLLSLVPALAGTGAALFTYSLFHASISIMVLGFGGAIISITVDQGIAYLLFLDCTHETKGREASHEVYSIGLLAVVTSIGALLILSFSGFLIFAELGQFTALGILFSFLFVHWVFPRIFPVMPPGKERVLPLRRLVDVLYRTGKPGAIAAALLAFGLLFYAKPQFFVSLSSMNTVSESTVAADALVTQVWGNVGERVVLMNSSENITKIQDDNDRLLGKIEPDIHQQVLAGAFVPSMLFPGRKRAVENLAAWHQFWTGNRGDQVREALQASGTQRGFTTDAFADFFTQLDPLYAAEPQVVPVKFYRLFGIAENGRDAGLIQFITVQPGTNYDGADFLQRYGGNAKIFDANFFTKRLAELLFSTFTTMLVIIAVSLVLLLYVFYLNLRLTLLTLLPPFFAYVCTLGTLNLLGRPLDIPALMLSVVILGMGVDYAIFCVRAHQRYRDINHPSYGLVRVAVFMSGTSTLIGFGVLALAEHSMLKSIGITSLLGIGYSLCGSFLLLPPLLKGYFASENNMIGRLQATDGTVPIRDRFRTLEPYPRVFARFKVRFDPMFADLPRMLAERDTIRTIIDIGCGYGVPACWCLERYGDAEVYGIEPDPERVRVAALAIGERGRVTVGWAPELPTAPRPADIVLLLDMLHYLNDGTVAELLHRSFLALGDNGLVVSRLTLPSTGRPSWSWWLEKYRVRFSGGMSYYRSAERMVELMKEAGLDIIINEVSAHNPELVWMVGRVKREMADGRQ